MHLELLIVTNFGHERAQRGPDGRQRRRRQGLGRIGEHAAQCDKVRPLELRRGRGGVARQVEGELVDTRRHQLRQAAQILRRLHGCLRLVAQNACHAVEETRVACALLLPHASLLCGRAQGVHRAYMHTSKRPGQQRQGGKAEGREGGSAPGCGCPRLCRAGT